MDNSEAVIFVVLDLSAAFDTVDHAILLIQLEQRLGITATVLQWFRTYLCGRSLSVNVEGEF